MTHLLFRQEGLKTLASSVLLQLLQYVVLKEVLFFLEKWIFAFYVPEGHILRRIQQVVDFKSIGRILKSKYSGKITPIRRINPIKIFKLYLVQQIHASILPQYII